MLDNTMNLISANEELSIEENDAIDDVVENIMMGDELKTIANNPTTSKEKVRRRVSFRQLIF